MNDSSSCGIRPPASLRAIRGGRGTLLGTVQRAQERHEVAARAARATDPRWAVHLLALLDSLRPAGLDRAPTDTPTDSEEEHGR